MVNQFVAEKCLHAASTDNLARGGTPILGHIRDVRPEWVVFQAENLRMGVNF